MKKTESIFDLINNEQNLKSNIMQSQSSYFSRSDEEQNDDARESWVGSSFNYFKESKLEGEEFFMEESEYEDKSSFQKNEVGNLVNNSEYNENDFIKISRLGNGSYGQAFKIKQKETNKIFALKEINKSKLLKENKYYQLKTENDLLKLCSHPNIVKYYGFYENQTSFSIIEEYCPYGDLSSFISENKQNLSILEIQYIIAQIIICLEYLSTKKIIHRDIKPENFLITDDFNLKLIDFGTATFFGKIFDSETNEFVDDNCPNTKKSCESFVMPHKLYEEHQSIPNNVHYSSFKYKINDVFQSLSCPFDESEKNSSINKFEDIKRQKFVGTAEYMAPEIINSQKTGYYTDMWSLICILYLCFTGHTPFSDKTEYLIFQNITQVKYSEKNIDLIPKEALDLITKFFKAEPSQRLGYKNEKEFDFNIIKNHPFFKLKDDNINLSEIKQQLMNKCSYYIKHLEKRNKNKNKKIKENEEKDSFSCDRNHLKNNNIMNDTNNTDMEENIDDYFKEEEDKGDGNNRIIKRGLLKKQSPYFYYDLRKVILYNTPRIDYIDPETNILKGSINLTKKCHSQLIKSNQFKLITPKRTYIFMCKERYDISPWVSAINKAIEKYSP